MAFSLSRAGASPDSGSALDEIFGFPRVGVHKAANAVDLSLADASAGPTTLEVANRLFPDDGFSMLDDFVHTAATQYGAVVQPVDTGDGAAAADTINSWVSQKTRGLIPTIVNERVVQDQELILVNTVYLKADWLWPFLPGRTRDGQFTVGDNQSVTVPFMSDREPVSRRFVLLEDADAVELLYKGSELAMWLIVPHDPTGLAAVEESLDAEALTGLPDAAQTGLVDITMPKWEQTLPPADLFEWLCPQGFCAGAGFDGIAPGIFITAALHGAKSHRRRKGHRSSRSHIHVLRRVHASRTRPHHRRRPAIPVGHHPPRHRCPTVRRPPRRPNRVEQTARPHSTARMESSNPYHDQRRPHSRQPTPRLNLKAHQTVGLGSRCSYVSRHHTASGRRCAGSGHRNLMVQDIRTLVAAPGLGHVEGSVGGGYGCCGGANPRGHRSWVRGVALVGDAAGGPLAR